MILIAVVGISALLTYVATAPRYDSESNTIKYISSHKPEAEHQAKSILSAMNLIPHKSVPGIHPPRPFNIEASDSSGNTYAFMFKETRFLTRVTARVIESKENPSAKPLRTETQLVKELAERIGI